MQSPSLPLIILGGRDRAGTTLPEAGRGKHVLQGYKAVDLKVGGRPLINILLDRLRESGRFDPIYIAGPRAIYESLVSGVRFIETDGGFGDNIRASIETATRETPNRPLAFITSDILPTPEDLQRCLADYDRNQPLDYWVLTIREPMDPGVMGESAWKPKYKLRPEGEKEMVGVMPGHLLIAETANLRLRLLYTVIDTIYKTRNRPLTVRRAAMFPALAKLMFSNDIRRLFTGRWPTFTWSLASNGLSIVARLLAGGIDQKELGDRLHRAVARERHRKAHPEHSGRFGIADAISLARDIDTEEEAREITGAANETTTDRSTNR